MPGCSLGKRHRESSHRIHLQISLESFESTPLCYGSTGTPSHQTPLEEDKEHQSSTASQHEAGRCSNHQGPKSLSSSKAPEHDVEHSHKDVRMDQQTWFQIKDSQNSSLKVSQPQIRIQMNSAWPLPLASLQISFIPSKNFKVVFARPRIEKLHPIDMDWVRHFLAFHLSCRSQRHGRQRSQDTRRYGGPGLYDATFGNAGAGLYADGCQDQFPIYKAVAPEITGPAVIYFASLWAGYIYSKYHVIIAFQLPLHYT